MKRIKLPQTFFTAVPMKNVVGIGNSTAYRISVTRGKVHATMGQLEFADLEAANDAEEARVIPVHRPRQILSRIFYR